MDLYPTQKSILGSGGKVKNLNVEKKKKPKETKKPLKLSVESMGEYIYDVGKIYNN